MTVVSAGQSAAQHVSRQWRVTQHCQNHGTLCLPFKFTRLYLLIQSLCVTAVSAGQSAAQHVSRQWRGHTVA